MMLLPYIRESAADFKRQFTYESYQEFFAAAGYKDVKYTMIEGRVPCAVAVIKKGKPCYAEGLEERYG